MEQFFVPHFEKCLFFGNLMEQFLATDFCICQKANTYSIFRPKFPSPFFFLENKLPEFTLFGAGVNEECGHTSVYWLHF
jgi:hypothetical protein